MNTGSYKFCQNTAKPEYTLVILELCLNGFVLTKKKQSQNLCYTRAYFKLYRASTAAGMCPAAMLPAGVFRSMGMIVVPTAHIGIKVQLSFEQSLYRTVSLAGYAAVQLDARRRQGRLGAAANPAANQSVRFQRGEYAGQSAVPASVGSDHLG